MNHHRRRVRDRTAVKGSRFAAVVECGPTARWRGELRGFGRRRHRDTDQADAGGPVEPEVIAAQMRNSQIMAFDTLDGVSRSDPTMTSGEAAAKQRQRRVGRGLSGWVRPILLALLILVATLAGAGLIYQWISTRSDHQAFPPPGQLVDIGGYRLHVNCMGEGSPTLILDASGGNSSANWGLVQPDVAGSMRVCVYDRAGMGWSDRGPTPRDASQQVRELHALLSRARIEGPYVLVGHSYGARIARVYTQEYPGEVVGMVLIDPGTLDDDPRFPQERRDELKKEKRTVALARWLAPFGLVRLLKQPDDYGDLPSQQAAAEHSFTVTTKYFQAIEDQFRAMPDTLRQERQVMSLGSIPLIVVSATLPDDEMRQVWNEINGELVKLSTNSVHRVVQGAEHQDLVRKRVHAEVTMNAIQEVVQAVRTGNQLAS
jgi:pimeloyl-ACP methyl ester carboxylesterase